MNETLFTALFLWAIVFGSLIAATFTIRGRRRIPWVVGAIYLVATVFTALASAISATYLIATGLSARESPLAPWLLLLRVVAAAMYLGLVFYFWLPGRAQVRLEHFFRLS